MKGIIHKRRTNFWGKEDFDQLPFLKGTEKRLDTGRGC